LLGLCLIILILAILWFRGPMWGIPVGWANCPFFGGLWSVLLIWADPGTGRTISARDQSQALSKHQDNVFQFSLYDRFLLTGWQSYFNFRSRRPSSAQQHRLGRGAR